jgi:hypothetical protein
MTAIEAGVDKPPYVVRRFRWEDLPKVALLTVPPNAVPYTVRLAQRQLELVNGFSKGLSVWTGGFSADWIIAEDPSLETLLASVRVQVNEDNRAAVHFTIATTDKATAVMHRFIGEVTDEVVTKMHVSAIDLTVEQITDDRSIAVEEAISHGGAFGVRRLPTEQADCINWVIQPPGPSIVGLMPARRQEKGVRRRMIRTDGGSSRVLGPDEIVERGLLLLLHHPSETQNILEETRRQLERYYSSTRVGNVGTAIAEFRNERKLRYDIAARIDSMVRGVLVRKVVLHALNETFSMSVEPHNRTHFPSVQFFNDGSPPPNGLDLRKIGWFPDPWASAHIDGTKVTRHGMTSRGSGVAFVKPLSVEQGAWFVQRMAGSLDASKLAIYESGGSHIAEWRRVLQQCAAELTLNADPENGDPLPAIDPSSPTWTMDASTLKELGCGDSLSRTLLDNLSTSLQVIRIWPTAVKRAHEAACTSMPRTIGSLQKTFLECLDTLLIPVSKSRKPFERLFGEPPKDDHPLTADDIKVRVESGAHKAEWTRASMAKASLDPSGKCPAWPALDAIGPIELAVTRECRRLQRLARGGFNFLEPKGNGFELDENDFAMSTGEAMFMLSLLAGSPQVWCHDRHAIALTGIKSGEPGSSKSILDSSRTGWVQSIDETDALAHQLFRSANPIYPQLVPPTEPW